MSYRKHDGSSSNDDESSGKDKLAAKHSQKRSKSLADEQEGHQKPEKNHETMKVALEMKSLTKKLSERSRSSANNKKAREGKRHGSCSDEETKKIKSVTRELSRRLESSASDDGRSHKKTGQEDEKLLKKNARKRDFDKDRSEKQTVAINSSNNSSKVKLVPGMLGKKRLWSGNNDQQPAATEKKLCTSTSKEDEIVFTPVGKKVTPKIAENRLHSTHADENGNRNPSTERRIHESSCKDETAEHFFTLPESGGSRVKVLSLKAEKRPWSSTESQEDRGKSPEKKPKLEAVLARTVAGGKRRDSKPSNDGVGKVTENVNRSRNKKRAKSPEIFAHNLKVLRKKSGMRRRKLTKEVTVFTAICYGITVIKTLLHIACTVLCVVQVIRKVYMYMYIAWIAWVMCLYVCVYPARFE